VGKVAKDAPHSYHKTEAFLSLQGEKESDG